MVPWLAALLLTAVAVADDPVAEPVAAPSPADVQALRDAAADLAASKDFAAARSLLLLLQDRPLSEADATAVAAQLKALPPTADEWQPVVRLVVVESAAMAIALGPGLVATRTRYTPSGVPLVTGLVGVGLGAGGALLLHQQVGLTYGRASAVMTAQALGLTHGLAFGLMSDRDTVTAWGALAGTGVGTVAGVALATRALDDGVTAAAQVGGLAGVGLTLAGLGALSLYDDLDEDAWELPLVLAVGADVGVVGGALLGDALDLSRATVSYGSLGGGGGALLGLAVIGGTQEWILWTPTSTAWLIGGTGVAGAVGGVLLGERLDRTRDGTRARLAPLLPSPQLRGGLQLTLEG